MKITRIELSANSIPDPEGFVSAVLKLGTPAKTPMAVRVGPVYQKLVILRPDANTPKGTVLLEDIYCSDPGKGLAGKVLSDIVKLADKFHVPLKLSAVPYKDINTPQFEVNQERLKKWYRSLSFKDDENTFTFMYRMPK